MIKYLNNEICIEVHSLERYNIFMEFPKAISTLEVLESGFRHIL